MNNTDQIAAEAAKKIRKDLFITDKVLNEENFDRITVPHIKAAIGKAYQLGWNKGWSKRNEVASKISDEIKEQLPKEKEEQPFSWIDNPPPSPRQ